MLLAAAPAAAQDTPPGAPPDAPPPASHPWSALPEAERNAVEELLASPDWPVRVFGLIRLERFEGIDIDARLRPSLRDEAWQVRCFALRQAVRCGLTVTAADLPEDESEPRVVRTALRSGIPLDEELVRPMAMRLMATKALEELMLGIEIAAACDIERTRKEGSRRIKRLIRNMDGSVEALVGRRLAYALDLPQPPQSLAEWHAWLDRQDGRVELRSTGGAARRLRLEPRLMVTDMEIGTFVRLLDYLDVLRQRDLEMVVVMDATSSMIPMINEARAGIDSLILFFNDVARTMRLAFIAYRDHDNRPVWQGHPFTTDVTSIRRFLFDIRITGGADLPEAVLDGLSGCEELEWSEEATRQIILVGDARPHDDDIYKVNALVQSFRNRGIVCHAVHIPMTIPPERARALGNAYLQQVEEHNRRTETIFGEIAEHGGGQLVSLVNAKELVPSIMRVTLHEGWAPVFDEFYELYLQMCR